MIKYLSQCFLRYATLILFGIVLLTVQTGSVSAKNVQKIHLLVLNSYAKGFPWTDNIVKGIESTLKSVQPDVELKIEYMDSKAIKYEPAYKKILYDLYSYKYKKFKFDVIVTSDDNALNFVREFHDDIFSGTKVVFCGVNNLKAPDLVDRIRFTGILEKAAEKETIELARKLNPKIRRVVVVSDTTPSGNYRWKQLEQVFPEFPGLEFIRFDDRYDLSDIEEKMKNLEEDTIAIFASLYRDKSGRFISLSEGASRISNASKQPIYTYHLQVLEYGTIGGKLLGGIHHGQKAAEMALRIIQGEKVQNIPVVKDSVAKYIFDYHQLKRFKIKTSNLPKNSLIVNKPVSFYKENKTLVWSIGLCLCVLIMAIIILQINIVKRKLSEKDLKLSNKRYQTLFNDSPVPLWEEDFSEVYDYFEEHKKKGVNNFKEFFDKNPSQIKKCAQKVKILNINQATLKLHDAKNKEDLLGKLDQIFTEKSFDTFIKEELIALADGQVEFESEGEIKTLAEEQKHIFLKLIINKEPSGSIKALLATTDITKRKQIEDELRVSEQYLKSIYDAAENIAFFVTDLDGKDTKILDVSPGAEKIFRYTRDKIIGKKVTIFHPPETVEDFPKMQAELFKNRKGYSGETVLVRKSGDQFPALFTIHPKFDKKGEINGTIGVAIDITERKIEEEKYKKTIEGSIDGFWIVDMRGNFLEVNQAYSNMIGYSRNEILNMSIMNVETKERPEETKKRIEKIVKNGSARFESKHRHKKGHIIDVEVSMTFTQDNGGMFYVFLRNITEKNQMEERLRQAQKMESIGNLAGGIAHDFNNLLFPIIGMSEMLLEDLPSDSLDYENAQEIFNAGRRAADLVKQILTFSRQSEHKMTAIRL